MIVKVNERNEIIDKKINIAELILRKGLTLGSVVVEHNSRIVPREEWPHIMLKENDSVEIIKFMGGG